MDILHIIIAITFMISSLDRTGSIGSLTAVVVRRLTHSEYRGVV